MKSIHRLDNSFDTAADLARQAGGSKAVAGAIRALHEKISGLENDNQRLQVNITMIQQNSLNEIEKLQKHYKEEIFTSVDKERKLNTKIREQEEEIQRNQSRTVKLEDHIHLLESNLQAADSLQKRTSLQQSFYRENFIPQNDQFEISLNQKRKQEEDHLKNIKLLEVNKKSLENQISLYRNQLRDLQQEVEKCKLHNNAEKIYSVKPVIQKDSTDLLALSSLQELCNYQNQQIKELQKKLLESQNALKKSEEMSLELEAEKEKMQVFVKDVISVNEQLISSLKNGSPNSSDLKVIEKHKRVRSTSSRNRRHKEASLSVANSDAKSITPTIKPVSLRQPDYHGRIIKNKLQDQTPALDITLDASKTKITELESEIDELNKRYKRAMLRSSSEDIDFGDLRKELNNLANAIESRCQELYVLKTRSGCNAGDISF